MKKLLLLAGAALAAVALSFGAVDAAKERDTNDSGGVDLADYNYCEQWYGQSVPPADPECDQNGDNSIDLSDQMRILNAFGMPGLPDFWVGVNFWHLGFKSSITNNCGDSGTIDQWLPHLRSKGVEVLRVAAYQNYATKADGTRDWSGFDQAVQKAQDNGMYIIFVFANQWADCDYKTGTSKPANLDCAFYQGGYATTPRGGYPQTYKAWVQDFVARYWHRAPVIGLELINEPRGATECVHNFFVDMTNTIRAIDKVSWLSFGGNEDGGWSDEAELDIPGITHGTVHGPYGPQDGSEWTEPLPSHVESTIAEHLAEGKPTYVGERGFQMTDETTRAQYLEAAITAARDAGASGFLFWEWCDGDALGDGDNCIGQGNPSEEVFDNFLPNY